MQNLTIVSSIIFTFPYWPIVASSKLFENALAHIKIPFELHLSAFLFAKICFFLFLPQPMRSFMMCFILSVFFRFGVVWNRFYFNEKRYKMIYDLIIGYAGVMHQNVIAWVHEFKCCPFFVQIFYDVISLFLNGIDWE